MPHFDVTCIGNAKIDTFLTLHEANAHLRLIKETNELAIKFGEKITVNKAEILLGGNAANVSVGASRLGLNVALVAEIGKDEFAQKIINTLVNEKVDISNVTQTQGQQSSFSTIINYKGERTIFSEHVKRLHDFNFEKITTSWVYLTSLGERWQDAYSKTINFVKETKSNLAFNPGTPQFNSEVDSIKNVLSITDILFVNKEEAEILASSKEKEIKNLILKIKQLGPKTIVITDGKNGSFAMNEKNEFFSQPILQTPIVEKTGAGDAYSSGFLGAILYGKSLREAMVWGTKNSASVIGKVGATAGLLCKNDLT